MLVRGLGIGRLQCGEVPAIRAERLRPEAIFIPPDFIRYRAVSHATREIFQRHTDLIEPFSLDEAYLDVTENKTSLPTATRVAKAIRQQIRDELQLTASAGVAPNKFLAKIASDWRKPEVYSSFSRKTYSRFFRHSPSDAFLVLGRSPRRD